METINFVVDPDKIPSGSCRLDVYASTQEGMSRSRLKNGIDSILVNGKDAKLSYKLVGNEQVSLQWNDPVPENILPEDIKLNVIYEDENVTVINKPQGMVTHPAAGNWAGTLVNALLFHWGRDSIYDTPGLERETKRPGIVHRLDKDTSGLIITAKNRDAEDWLQAQFKERRVRKEYIAICKGMPVYRSGSIKTQIVRDPKNRKRFTTSDNPDIGKFAWTQYKCIGVYGHYSLMHLKLKTGRTHQIRVHMKHLGCPILGDPIYNKKDSIFDTATLMLHSFKMALRLPNDNSPTFFKAPVPLRFKKVLRVLHKQFEKVQRPLNPSALGGYVDDEEY